MSIRDIAQKIKLFSSNQIVPVISRIKTGLEIKEDIFIVLTIILIGLAGFGLGKLSALEKGQARVAIKPANFAATGSSFVASSSSSAPAEGSPGLLVASQNGTKYHFPWCAGVAQIAEKNKIWFNSYEAAQAAGYTAASNCPGLK